MTNLWTGIAFLAFLVVASLGSYYFGSRLPRQFRSRPCQGKAWREGFPTLKKAEIRTFLSLFADSFALRKSQSLKLNPNDHILGVYRAINPSKLLPDAMELETLALSVEQTYGFQLLGVWSEHLTLGELLSHVCSRQVAAHDA